MFKKFALFLLFVTTISHADMTKEMYREVFKSKKIAELYDKAADFQKNKQYFELIKIMDELIKLSRIEISNLDLRDKFVSFLYVFKADCNYRLQNYSKALSDCETALFKDENNAEAYYVKGYIYICLGNWKMANVCIKRAAKMGHRQAQDEVIAYNL